MHVFGSVHIHCQRCGARFAPPVQITDIRKLEEFAAWGGIIDCMDCHHFIEVGRHNLSYGQADGSTQCLATDADPRHRITPTADDNCA